MCLKSFLFFFPSSSFFSIFLLPFLSHSLLPFSFINILKIQEIHKFWMYQSYKKRVSQSINFLTQLVTPIFHQRNQIFESSSDHFSGHKFSSNEPIFWLIISTDSRRDFFESMKKTFWRQRSASKDSLSLSLSVDLSWTDAWKNLLWIFYEIRRWENSWNSVPEKNSLISDLIHFWYTSLLKLIRIYFPCLVSLLITQSVNIFIISHSHHFNKNCDFFLVLLKWFFSGSFETIFSGSFEMIFIFFVRRQKYWDSEEAATWWDLHT